MYKAVLPTVSMRYTLILTANPRTTPNLLVDLFTFLPGSMTENLPRARESDAPLNWHQQAALLHSAGLTPLASTDHAEGGVLGSTGWAPGNTIQNDMTKKSVCLVCVKVRVASQHCK